MNFEAGSSCGKELFCYFHVGGKFVTNGEGEVRYNGGGVRLRSIKDGLTLDELRLMISEWIGGDGRNYDIKYTVAFDEKTLIDLHDNAEMYNLFQYNGNSGHVYVAEKRQVGPQPRDNVEITERFMGMSQQTELDASPISLCCDYGWLSEENARECDNDEISGPPNVDKSIGAEDTDGSEMVHAEWRGLLTGVGQRFPSADVFRVSVYKFALANKFVAKYMRNSKEFMSIRCKVEGCPWKLCANHVGKSCDVLRVTTFINRHVHSAQDSLDVMHSGRASLNSSIIIDEMRDHADKRTSEIRKRLKREYGIDLTYKQAYRAREKSLEDIYGRPEQSYMLIPWLCERIKETDEKSVAEWTAIGNRFERVFIAYGACIEGFLGGARHIMYVDGTHLSGPYKGTMLSASAYDADNELLPFAIAIVKGETLDDWTWFFYMIKKILGSVEVTIVSDRHNAIIGGVASIFGGQRHAFCYRHIKENFSSEVMKMNKGQTRTNGRSKEDALYLLDKIAYARTDEKFEAAMDDMRSFSPRLFDWLIHHGDVDRWAKSRFPYKRWDNITTNIAESFNAWMVNERKHTVPQLIYEHRDKVARKLHASYVGMTKWKNCVGPNIESKVLDMVAGSDHMYAENYGGGRVKVTTSRGDHRVDLGLHQCSCRSWQMTGIPCSHACAAIKIVHGQCL
ncbi:uncharacterized protein LOC114715203 [Neltuma alba]|uniref:uncharacterized protein LOC114715203 n=1 Tax=Neltuma alba TaxID=207710 RepID=UPI0010A54BE8|nr:uncharacterized protein LOC114715203 [Prosopis alba]